jgi:hypothetical protein
VYKADNPLSHRSGKRFRRDCCPEWFFYGFQGVREVGIMAVNDYSDTYRFLKKFHGTCGQITSPAVSDWVWRIAAPKTT